MYAFFAYIAILFLKYSILSCRKYHYEINSDIPNLIQFTTGQIKHLINHFRSIKYFQINFFSDV